MDELHWHLDKRVPLALIFAIFVQTGGALWWASAITSQTEQLQREVERNIEALKAAGSIEPRLVRVETDITYIRGSVDDNADKLHDLDEKLDALIQRYRETSQ
jgi:hypothetical protein